ncbi:hypothetical protein HK44_008010 [Pseudomonas fluorescens HK44]|uniref:Uncharacterized protein n=1 Tax=Pseudomonas fluorescens HK44 TaxID=1042209 RepID=A0A010SMF9_PSEFL|nr:hypothetical protein [Pseudomonas fluorescens]EXF94135.1 hypothetical protein HK44_008010 [Pseudomonas fluorescens HK44]
MTIQSTNLFEMDALKTQRMTKVFSLLALLTTPVVLLICWYLGVPESWASKSAPLMTVFSILAVQHAQAMGDGLRSDGQFEPNEFIEAQNKYKRSAGRHMLAATWLAIVGALIGVFAG